MKRALALLYGVSCYTVALAVFAYLAGFLANLWVPTSVDAGTESSVGVALLVNTLLLAVFGLQHSVMARPGFKRMISRLVPRPVERSTYVLVSCAVMALFFWQWRPMGAELWNITHPIGSVALWSAYGIGWGLLLASTFVINHFDLFGLHQVFDFARDKDHADPKFSVRFFYRFVRHPIYTGWLMVFWATPTMTVGHLFLAAGMTVYILIAIQLEERDLVSFHGEDYARYKSQVPMLLPTGSTSPALAPAHGAAGS